METERRLIGSDEGGLHWELHREHGGARLRYVERRDGTIRIEAARLHPALMRRGGGEMLAAALDRLHPCLVAWNTSAPLPPAFRRYARDVLRVRLVPS